MKSIQADVAIIGAGSAGLAAYRAASEWTDNVVLIEGGPYGTTCARVGCMPSKLLIAAAESAHSAHHAAGFGVVVDNVKIDGEAVMERVRRERDRFVGFVVDGVENIPSHKRIRGFARFLDDHNLQIDEHTTVRAARIVIATGSSPHYPDAWRALGERLIVNDDIFEWRDLPRSVAVFGTGVIGIELGQALSRLGVKVSLLGRGDSVGPLSDPMVREAAHKALSKELNWVANADLQSLERVPAGVEIRYRDASGKQRRQIVDYVVAATGRRPNVAGLGLENTSLPLDARRVPRFDPRTLQIADSHVFIAGDANNELALLHEAADEGRAAGTNAGRYPDVQPGLRRSPLTVVFSDPQIAMIGSRWVDLDPADIVTGEVSFEDQGRSRVMRQNQGVLRVYADVDNGRLLGAEMVGPRAEHLAHLLAWAHQSGHSIETLLDMPFYHPVIEEGVRTALRDAAAKLRIRLAKAA